MGRNYHGFSNYRNTLNADVVKGKKSRVHVPSRKPGGPRQYSDETVAKVRGDHEFRGKTIEEIVGETGISHYTIKGWLTYRTRLHIDPK